MVCVVIDVEVTDFVRRAADGSRCSTGNLAIKIVLSEFGGDGKSMPGSSLDTHTISVGL